MAIFTAGSSRQRAEINVTPLIDVLLVLLIIFMIILPDHSNGLDTLVPQQPSDEARRPVENTQVVITVDSEAKIHLNQEAVERVDLAARLMDLFKDRPSQPVFLRAAPDLEFRDVAAVIDVIKGAGMNRIALITAPF